MDFSSVTAAFTGIKTATEIATLIKTGASSLEDAEVKLKLAELIDALAEAKMEIANVKVAMLEKEDELSKLKTEIQIESEIVWEDPYYFRVNAKNEKDGPYCQKCYDSKKMLIRLQSPNKNGAWDCKECDSCYIDKTWHDEEQEIVDNLNIQL